MGCDIHGQVEVREHEDASWWGTAQLLGVVGRDYDTFGCLFGVRGTHWTNSAFGKRGLPDGLAINTRRRLREGDGLEGESVACHSRSYFTVSELRDVDWSETAANRDWRYSVLDEDLEPTGHKFGWSSGWAEIINENEEALAEGEAVPNEDGTRYVKRIRNTRREALSGAWEWFLFDLLETYADRFGAENVRVVVWFDN